MMTAKEAIGAVNAGERAITPHSLHTEVVPNSQFCTHPKGWRTIACDGETDVVECPKCGRQWTEICNFDEEYT